MDVEANVLENSEVYLATVMGFAVKRRVPELDGSLDGDRGSDVIKEDVVSGSVDVKLKMVSNSEVDSSGPLAVSAAEVLFVLDVCFTVSCGSYSEDDSSDMLVASEAEIIFVPDVSLSVASGDVIYEKADDSLTVVSVNV